MSTGLYGGAVRSPRAGHTIKQLTALKEAGWHNADTGTELHEEEAENYLHHLHQKDADRRLDRHLKIINSHRSRSRGRDWIPKDKVVFRYIHGHVVPFRQGSEVFL